MWLAALLRFLLLITVTSVGATQCQDAELGECQVSLLQTSFSLSTEIAPGAQPDVLEELRKNMTLLLTTMNTKDSTNISAFKQDSTQKSDFKKAMRKWYDLKEFDANFQLYGINSARGRQDPFWQITVLEDGKCYISLPVVDSSAPYAPVANNFLSEPVYSGFTFGECPRVLPVDAVHHLTQLNGSSALTKLPPNLTTVFPSGRWLALSKTGNSSGHLHVLDENFESIDSTLVDFGAAAASSGLVPVITVTDPRLMLQEDGSIAFTITLWYESSEGHREDCQFVGLLRTQPFVKGLLGSSSSSSSSKLFYVSVVDIRSLVMQEDPGKGGTACSADRKNMMLMQKPGDDLYVTDWLYPPKIGKVDLKSEPYEVSLEGTNGSALASLYKYSAYKLLPDESVWGLSPNTKFKPSEKTAPSGYNQPSGGPPLVWLEDHQQFLGIGHFHRGPQGDSMENVKHGHTAALYTHHYTFFFFTLSKSSPFQLTSMSSEFCFPSDFDAADCEVIQFTTALERDGEKLQIMYSAMDKDARMATVNMQSVLSRLKPLQ
jgi:hypothetical protein